MRNARFWWLPLVACGVAITTIVVTFIMSAAADRYWGKSVLPALLLRVFQLWLCFSQVRKASELRDPKENKLNAGAGRATRASPQRKICTPALALSTVLLIAALLLTLRGARLADCEHDCAGEA